MAGISRYEKIVLGMTAAFLLFTGGWFLARQNVSAPYEVTATRGAEGTEGSISSAQPVEEGYPDSLLEREVIDLNLADVYELQRLPGIGEKRAQAIVAYREEHGPFQTAQDLTRVSGIGEGILSGLLDYVTVGGAEN